MFGRGRGLKKGRGLAGAPVGLCLQVDLLFVQRFLSNPNLIGLDENALDEKALDENWAHGPTRGAGKGDLQAECYKLEDILANHPDCLFWLYPSA